MIEEIKNHMRYYHNDLWIFLINLKVIGGLLQ